ncbi:MAG: hypothetical protein J0L73_25190 [Verrucomicrobia bacterium]|nr:hypothetical protein [Verrucomicrobiota bacterium]
MKFATLNKAGEPVAFSYGDIYFRQPLSHGERLTIGPSASHVDLALALAGAWATQQYYILYVLLISHSGALPGRYQSPLIESFEDLQVFFYTFEKFLESDGRHHIWISSPAKEGTLVYDQHDVIFAYGDLSSYEAVLSDRGFQQQEFWFPTSHCHSYPASHVADEKDLLSHFDWQYSPLQEGDEYG